jgi:septal ring factor EnvC (AmiA/AmiB activator)
MIFKLEEQNSRIYTENEKKCHVLERDLAKVTTELANVTAELKITEWTLGNTRSELANAEEVLRAHKTWFTEAANVQLRSLLTELNTV